MGSAAALGAFRRIEATLKRCVTTSSFSSAPIEHGTRGTCSSWLAAQLPPTAAAGVGMVSLRSMLARRIVRILDSSRLLSTRAGTRAVVAMVIVGFSGTLLAGLVGVGGGQRKAEARTELKAEDAEPIADDATVRGQVVDPDGKPVPGATVTAVRSLGVDDGIGDTRFPRPSDHEYIHQVTDRDGRSVSHSSTPLRTVPTKAKAFKSWRRRPGFGLGYSAKGGPIRLTRDAVPVKGRLVDLEGRPAAGVTICLTRASLSRAQRALVPTRGQEQFLRIPMVGKYAVPR